MRPHALLACGVAIVTIAVGLIAGAGTSWIVLSTPNPSNVNYLFGLTAISASDSWSVGYDYSNSTQSTLTEHWDGTRWRVIPSPSPGTAAKCGIGVGYTGNMLNGVFAVASNNVWAVGSVCGYSNSQTLIEHWNGSRWVVVPSPNDDGPSFLTAVAGTSANDLWAAGNYQVGGQYSWKTLIEHWDGAQWTLVESPNNNADKNFLTAVAVLSPSDVWAVGYSENTSGFPADTPLIEHYDGGGWSIIPSVYPSGSDFNSLYAVAAVSPSDVWAVGYGNVNSAGQPGAALIEHWDGTNWSLVTSPVLHGATTLYGISALSSTDIWAAGYVSNVTPTKSQYIPVTEHWNGTAWMVVPAPDPGKAAQLYSVAAANGRIWAAGSYSQSGVLSGFMQNPLTLIMAR